MKYLKKFNTENDYIGYSQCFDFRQFEADLHDNYRYYGRSVRGVIGEIK
jgi:hypothetical protein